VRARIAVPFDFAVRDPPIGGWHIAAIAVAGGILGALLREVK
jgi:hypothetical protein